VKADKSISIYSGRARLIDLVAQVHVSLGHDFTEELLFHSIDVADSIYAQHLYRTQTSEIDCEDKPE